MSNVDEDDDEPVVQKVNEPYPQISVVSFNCWGLWIISKRRKARLGAIADRIAEGDYDIVALQEIWVREDYVNLRKKTSSTLPYGKYYYSGVFGGGLAVLSKYPILGSSMFKYPLNGRPIAVWRGDWYVGKGVACASLQHPSGQIIELFNTHLHAPYAEKVDTYMCHRTAQAWELAKMIRGAVQRGRIVLAVGDFNSTPDSLTHELITRYGLVVDSWQCISRKTEDIHSTSLSALQNIELLGATCDSSINTWRRNHGDGDMHDPDAQRLDYVFCDPGTLTVNTAQVLFTDIHPDLGCSYSDHFGIHVRLALKASAVNHSSVRREIVDQVLLMIDDYRVRQQTQSELRLLHFYASIVALIALHIGIFWSPHNWVSFILLFVVFVISVTGLIDGVIGFVFGWTELNCLAEFAAEVNLLRATIGKSPKLVA